MPSLMQAEAMLEHGADYPLEEGAAGMTITLSHGTIEVRHMEDNTLLARAEDVPEGAWSRLWDALFYIGCETVKP